MINIVTWNVNGIRSRVFNNKISSSLPKNKEISLEDDSAMFNLLQQYNPDIICFQETRCDENNGNLLKLSNCNNYNKYFNSSKLEGARSANRYSGTAIFTKIKPQKIEYNVPDYDDKEGRIIIMYFESFIVINIYGPNSGTNYDNKIIFQKALLKFINNQTLPIIYCGDFNIAIDTHFDKTKVKPSPGIYPHELQYYQELIDIGLIDCKDGNRNRYGNGDENENSNDYIYKDDIIYTWWDQRSKKILNPETNVETNVLRYKNRGWRLDYIFVKKFTVIDYKVLKHIGEEYCPHSSDHAAVFTKLKLN